MQAMTEFQPADYGPVFEPLLAIDRCRSLDGGQPNRAALAELERLSPETAFAHTRISNWDMARSCIAGMWLLHDFLDRSHEISQGIDTTSGSLWHAIMHRREGDFSNAKYWLRRVGAHPVFEPLTECAGELASEHGAPTPQFLVGGNWEPFAFVDACQQAVRGGAGGELCKAVQQVEWERLFDYCYRAAT
jgi:hypothetical protein